eukprot:SAG11_NODE_31299_length_293_cov_0.690722_1_plen_48_part_01
MCEVLQCAADVRRRSDAVAWCVLAQSALRMALQCAADVRRRSDAVAGG